MTKIVYHTLRHQTSIEVARNWILSSNFSDVTANSEHSFKMWLRLRKNSKPQSAINIYIYIKMEAFTDKVKETFGWLLPFHPGWSHCNYVINLLSPGTFGINGVLKRCVIEVKSPVRMQENDRRILEEIGKEEWNTHWERERDLRWIMNHIRHPLTLLELDKCLPYKILTTLKALTWIIYTNLEKLRTDGYTRMTSEQD